MTIISSTAIINAIRLKEQASSPATPAAGYGLVYAKTDGFLYLMDDAGVEHPVGRVADVNGMVGSVTVQAGSGIAITNQSGNVISIASVGTSGDEVPGAIPGIVGWWRADDLYWLADAAAVTLWPCRLRGGLFGPLTAVGTGATYKTNIVNGHSVVRFAGSTANYLRTTGVSDFATNFNKAMTWVAVMKPTSATTNHLACGMMGSGQYDYEFILPSTANWTLLLYTSGGAAYNAAHPYGSNPTANEFYMAAARMVDTVRYNGWRNGGASVTGTTFSGARSTSYTSMFLGVGNRGDSAGNVLDGDIAELILYNRALSTTELDAIGTYVADRYGLTISAFS